MLATQTTTLTSSASSQVSHPIPTLNPESSEFYQQFREIKANSPDRINSHRIQNSALNALEELTPKQRASMPLFEGACATYTKLIMSDMEAALHPDNVNSLDSEEKKAMFLKLIRASQNQHLPAATREGLKNIIEELNKEQAFRGLDLNGADLSELDLSGLDLLDTIATVPVPTLGSLALLRLQREIPKEINPEDSEFYQVFATDKSGSIEQLTGLEVLKKMAPNQLAAMPLFKDACDEYVKLVLSGMSAGLTPSKETYEENTKAGKRIMSRISYKNLGSPTERGQIFIKLIKAYRDTSLPEATRSDLRKMVNELNKQRAFNRLDLRGADFRGMNLSNLFLGGSNLSGANLSKANLSNIQLQGANLSGANMSYASLNEADLTSANMTGANISHASLNNANLTDADMSKAILTYAEMSNTRLNHAKLIDAKLMGANLTKASLFCAKLTNANLTGADMSQTDLENANLTDANLTDANLTKAKLHKSNLTRTNIINAIITSSQLRTAENTEGMISSDTWYGKWQTFASSFAK